MIAQVKDLLLKVSLFTMTRIIFQMKNKGKLLGFVKFDESIEYDAQET